MVRGGDAPKARMDTTKILKLKGRTMKSETIPLRIIKTNCGTQQRTICSETKQAYAEAMKAGAKFPPLEIVQGNDGDILWDGFHRYYAMQSLGIEIVEVNVTAGTRRKAIELSLRANSTHGLPRDKHAKINSIRVVETDPEWRTKTDAQKSRMVGMSEHTYRRYRNEIPDLQNPKSDDLSVSGQNKSGNMVPSIKDFEWVREQFGTDFYDVFVQELEDMKWQMSQESWPKFYYKMAMEEKIDSPEKLVGFIMRQTDEWSEPDGTCYDGAIARAIIMGSVLKAMYRYDQELAA